MPPGIFDGGGAPAPAALAIAPGTAYEYTVEPDCRRPVLALYRERAAAPFIARDKQRHDPFRNAPKAFAGHGAAQELVPALPRQPASWRQRVAIVSPHVDAAILAELFQPSRRALGNFAKIAAGPDKVEAAAGRADQHGAGSPRDAGQVCE